MKPVEGCTVKRFEGCIVTEGVNTKEFEEKELEELGVGDDEVEPAPEEGSGEDKGAKETKRQ